MLRRVGAVSADLALPNNTCAATRLVAIFQPQQTDVRGFLVCRGSSTICVAMLRGRSCRRRGRPQAIQTICGHEDIGTIRRRVTLSSLAWAVGRPTGGVILVSRTTNPIFRALELAADVVFSTASQVTAPVEHWRRLSTAIFDPYRPELHYMRGPGPKWGEKHDYVGLNDLSISKQYIG